MEPIKPVDGPAITPPPSRGSAPAAPENSPKTTAGVAPQFVSPKGSIDAKSGVFVVQFRDTESGEVKGQVPPEKVVAEYTKSNRLGEGQSAPGTSGGAKVSGGSNVEAPSGEPADTE